MLVLQPHTLAGDGADADLGTGQVLQDGNLASEFTFVMANLADQTAVKGVVAVAKIEPCDVHPGADQSFQDFVR